MGACYGTNFAVSDRLEKIKILNPVPNRSTRESIKRPPVKRRDSKIKPRQQEEEDVEEDRKDKRPKKEKKTKKSTKKNKDKTDSTLGKEESYTGDVYLDISRGDRDASHV
jgi:hypothetical protein